MWGRYGTPDASNRSDLPRIRSKLTKSTKPTVLLPCLSFISLVRAVAPPPPLLPVCAAVLVRRPILTPSTPSPTSTMDDGSAKSMAVPTVVAWKTENITQWEQRVRQRIREAAKKLAAERRLRRKRPRTWTWARMIWCRLCVVRPAHEREQAVGCSRLRSNIRMGHPGWLDAGGRHRGHGVQLAATPKAADNTDVGHAHVLFDEVAYQDTI